MWRKGGLCIESLDDITWWVRFLHIYLPIHVTRYRLVEDRPEWQSLGGWKMVKLLHKGSLIRRRTRDDCLKSNYYGYLVIRLITVQAGAPRCLNRLGSVSVLSLAANEVKARSTLLLQNKYIYIYQSFQNKSMRFIS